MIYELIAKAIENYLGAGDYFVSYANNHDVNWTSILPKEENQIKHCVLRVDSGTTTQIGGRTIRTEQLRLMCAIPEDREIFDEAVTNLRSMLNGLNDTTIEDEDDNETALLTFGEYHDAQSQTVNGNVWWISEVVFIANFYDGVHDYNDVSVSILTTTSSWVKLGGVMSAKYQLQKTFDANVYNGNIMSKQTINSMQKILQIDLVYLKSNDLITSILNDEETQVDYQIVYNNGVKSRQGHYWLSSITETTITGDILKATITFINR